MARDVAIGQCVTRTPVTDAVPRRVARAGGATSPRSRSPRIDLERLNAMPKHETRRLLVVMFADLVGYSRMLAESERLARRALDELKTRSFEPVVRHHKGEVLKRMGDGWIVAFSSIAGAIACGMEVQERLDLHPAVKLRLGAHLGDVAFDQTDFYGPVVNLAERLQREAPPGGLLVSQDLFRLLARETAARFVAAGERQLKHHAEPLAVYSWRPQPGQANAHHGLPLILFEPIDAVPHRVDARATADEIHRLLAQRLAHRTGVRIVDAEMEPSEQPHYRLKGRFRLGTERGRLHLDLLRAVDGRSVWSRRYESGSEDVLRFCDDLVERADADLRLQINAFDAERLAGVPDEQLSVAELRTRAAGAFYGATMASWEHAARLLHRALELNPDDPMALAMRAEAKVMTAAARFETLDQTTLDELEHGLDIAVNALDRSDYVVWARGLFHVYARPDSVRARLDVEHVLSISPSYVPGFELEGLVHLLGGAYDAAGASFERAASLSEGDPMLPYRLFLQAVARFCQGDSERALRAVDHAVQQRPGTWAFHQLRLACLESACLSPQAEAAVRWAGKIDPVASIIAPRPPLPGTFDALLERLAPRLENNAVGPLKCDCLTASTLSVRGHDRTGPSAGPGVLAG